MQEKINGLSDKLQELATKNDALKDMFNALQQNVNLNISIMWGALAFVIAAAGGALYLLAKSWVNARVDKEVEILEKVYDEKFNNFVKKVKSPPQWIPPVIMYGWTAFMDDNEVAPGYCKDYLGKVHLRGCLKGGATATDTILLILPKGYRPSGVERFTLSTKNEKGLWEPASIKIMPSGHVLVENMRGNELLSLSGISFYAEKIER